MFDSCWEFSRLSRKYSTASAGHESSRTPRHGWLFRHTIRRGTFNRTRGAMRTFSPSLWTQSHSFCKPHIRRKGNCILRGNSRSWGWQDTRSKARLSILPYESECTSVTIWILPTVSDWFGLPASLPYKRTYISWRPFLRMSMTICGWRESSLPHARGGVSQREQVRPIRQIVWYVCTGKDPVSITQSLSLTCRCPLSWYAS